jgi:hypothetical protein
MLTAVVKIRHVKLQNLYRYLHLQTAKFIKKPQEVINILATL